MKGVVEIYGTKSDGSKDLLYQEENMTTVGFAENIVDMLTTPSSISLGAGTLLDETLSAGNYKIQAFSMSKAEEQFSQNLHTYRTNNLLFWTNMPTSSLGGTIGGNVGWIRSKVAATPSDEFGPVTSGNLWAGGTTDISVLRVGANTSAGYIGQEVMYEKTGGDTEYKFTAPYFSATDFVFSVDLKIDRDSPPIQVSADANGDYVGYSQLALSCNNSYHRMSIRWDEQGNAHLNSTPAGFSNTAGVDASGGIKYLGGGWHRAFIHGAYLGVPDTGTKTVVNIYPSIGEGADALVDTTNFITSSAIYDKVNGFIYISRPQLELGMHPTNYVEVPFKHTRDDVFRYSLLNSTPPYGGDGDHLVKINYYVVSGDASGDTWNRKTTGGPTLSGMYDGTFDKGVSAYLPPTTKAIPSVNPNDRELTPGVVTPVEEAFNVRINKGHNPGCAHLWDQFHVSSFDNSWTYTSGYTPLFGRHLLYLGTYPNSHVDIPAYPPLYPSGTHNTWDKDISGSMYVHYLSANNEAAYENPLSSTVFGARSLLTTGQTLGGLDAFGFLSILSEPVSGNAAGGWYRPVMGTEYFSDFSSTGEITYHLRTIESVGGSYAGPFSTSADYSSDKFLSNLFGGVNVIGLWGLDVKKIREDAISLGYETDAYPFTRATRDFAQILPSTTTSDIENRYMATPIRRYKLYNKKVLTDNIAKNEGFGTSAGIFGNYKNLDLYWRLKFL